MFFFFKSIAHVYALKEFRRSPTLPSDYASVGMIEEFSGASFISEAAIVQSVFFVLSLTFEYQKRDLYMECSSASVISVILF